MTILELAELVAETVGFTGEILTDPTKPDGTPRKLMDVSKIKATGWSPVIAFRDGLAGAYGISFPASKPGPPGSETHLIT